MNAPKLTRHTCYTLACSDCGEDPWDEFTPHFPTEEALWAGVLGEDGYGWTRRPDGRALCRSCSDRADCAERGHQMTPWSPLPRDPEVEWRHCKNCGGTVEDRLAALGGP
jgi:hypothetical protein